MNEEKIAKEAKALMDEFLAALEEAKDVKESVGFERDENVRTPAKSEFGFEFSDRMLENAPARKGRHVASEKKKW